MIDSYRLSALPAGHRILPMRRDNLDEIRALEFSGQQDPWSLKDFADEFENPVSAIDLYWCDHELAGFLCSWLILDELQIQNLVTAPAWRRQGVAAKLLAHVLERSRLSGMATAWLEVRAGNLAAVALYQRFGFKITGCRADYYPDGEDALLMTYQEAAVVADTTALSGE